MQEKSKKQIRREAREAKKAAAKQVRRAQRAESKAGKKARKEANRLARIKMINDLLERESNARKFQYRARLEAELKELTKAPPEKPVSSYAQWKWRRRVSRGGSAMSIKSFKKSVLKGSRR